MEDSEIKILKEKARNLRIKTFDMALELGEGHMGGSLSEIELLISLYDFILKKEDKFILSKGHACLPLYSLLSEKGFSPKITPHPDLDEKNGIYCTTGSLGHGLPIGVGMAFARKIKKKPGKIFVLISEGDCQEGTTWESSLIASKYKLDNLVVIIDHNKVQALDRVDDALPLGNLKAKFQEFGFHVVEINGHNFEEIIPALQTKVIEKPFLIIAHTIKGKGVSFMEDNPEWHGKRPTPERLKEAYEELGVK